MKERIDLLERELTDTIIDSFFSVYNYYGFGLLESVYTGALAYELRARGLLAEREVRAVIRYKGEPVARQRLDMLVEGKVIVESKAVERLPDSAEPQLLSYLNATGIEVGLLLHFGLKPAFRRLVCSARRRQSSG